MESDIAVKVEELSKVFLMNRPIRNDKGEFESKLEAIKNISFEIKKGESVGIIGPNGSGKSTLLKLLAGVAKPSSGKIYISGKVASILDIGAGFHTDLSGRENIFLNGQIHGFTKKEIKKELEKIIIFSGIEKFIDEPVKNYSNGMYLRLAFSIMVHLDFDIYLMDEVLNVGDANFRFQSSEKIKELSVSNKTMIVVSHNFNDLMHLDNYILLKAGEIGNFSGNEIILNDYVEESFLDKSNLETKNVMLNDFSSYGESQDLKVKRIEFTQTDQEDFRTDKPFKLIIEFEMLNKNVELEPAFSISDLHGNILLSSAPFISLGITEQKIGLQLFTCVIPASFFGFKTYRISIYFLKNLQQSSIYDGNMSLLEDRIVNSIYRMNNIITFRCHFNTKLTDFDFGNLKLDGGLLPAFNWTHNYYLT